MKRSGMLGTVIRRSGNAFRWLVRDRIGGVIAQGKEIKHSKAVEVARKRKQQILEERPAFKQQVVKGIELHHSVWASKHASK